MKVGWPWQFCRKRAETCVFYSAGVATMFS